MNLEASSVCAGARYADQSGCAEMDKLHGTPLP